MFRVSLLPLVVVHFVALQAQGATQAELTAAIRVLQKACESFGSGDVLKGARRDLNRQISNLERVKAQLEAAKLREQEIDDNTYIHDQGEGYRGPYDLDRLIRELGEGWGKSVRGRNRAKMSVEDAWAQSTLASLADGMVSRRDRSEAESKRVPLSSAFRRNLKELFKETAPSENHYKALFLFYGLDGNGSRSATEIGKQLGISSAQAKRYVDQAKAAFKGDSAIRLMKLIAKETKTDLVYQDGIGYVSPGSLAESYQAYRNQKYSNTPFKDIPVGAVAIRAPLLKKLETKLGLVQLHQLGDYFRANFLNRTPSSPPPDSTFTKEEIKEIYEKIQPVFWPHRNDLRFLQTLED